MTNFQLSGDITSLNSQASDIAIIPIQDVGSVVFDNFTLNHLFIDNHSDFKIIRVDNGNHLSFSNMNINLYAARNLVTVFDIETSRNDPVSLIFQYISLSECYHLLLIKMNSLLNGLLVKDVSVQDSKKKNDISDDRL